MRLYRQVSPIPAGWPPPELDAGAAATLTYARQRDPIGDRVQAGLVALYVFTLAMPGTSVNDIAWASLAGCALVRLPATWRCATVLLRDRLLWLFAAWFAWRAVSVLWSADHAAGLDELGAARVMLTPLMMWPVLDRAPLYVGAFLVGVFGHNAVQAAQALNWFGLEPDPFYRLSGFLHPIHLATLCMAAMCWHLSALLHGSGARRGAILAWTTGLAAATAGLVFTGSRGPWIAAAIALPAGLVLISLRRPAARRAAVAMVVLGVTIAAASSPWTGPFILFRVDQAVSNLQEARHHGEYNTDLGQRLMRWQGAVRLLAKRPLAGTGAGGYGRGMGLLKYDEEVTVSSDHAHSLYLHDAATLGLPGLCLGLMVLGVSLKRAWSYPPRDRYADGALVVLVGWTIGALFDCYHLSGTMFGLFTVVVALSMPRAATDPGNHDVDDSRNHQQDA